MAHDMMSFGNTSTIWFLPSVKHCENYENVGQMNSQGVVLIYIDEELIPGADCSCRERVGGKDGES